MTEKTLNAGGPGRMHWLDNLRTFMVFLVVVLHAGLVYESSGIAASFWIVDDPATNDFSGLVNLVLDLFVMPVIFFIAGFLAPRSLLTRSGPAFLRSRFRRLIVPWLVAVLTLLPLYKILFLYSRGLPQQHWDTYFHWSNGIWGQNWLWFLPVLFLFDILYLLLSRLDIDVSRITLKRAVPFLFAVGLAYAIVFDLRHLQGWTKTLLFDFQNERLLIYFLVFLAGALCFRLGAFQTQRRRSGLYLAIASAVWMPIMVYLTLVILPLLHPGRHVVSEAVDAVVRQVAFLLSLVCLLYLSTDTFRNYFNRQGRISAMLGRTSYGVYICHTVVLGGIALVLRDTSIPSLAKHLTLAALTYLTTAVFVRAYGKVRPPLAAAARSAAVRRPLLAHDNPSLRRSD